MDGWVGIHGCCSWDLNGFSLCIWVTSKKGSLHWKAAAHLVFSCLLTCWIQNSCFCLWFIIIAIFMFSSSAFCNRFYPLLSKQAKVINYCVFLTFAWALWQQYQCNYCVSRVLLLMCGLKTLSYSCRLTIKFWHSHWRVKSGRIAAPTFLNRTQINVVQIRKACSYSCAICPEILGTPKQPLAQKQDVLSYVTM